VAFDRTACDDPSIVRHVRALTPPLEVMLARAVQAVPQENALPGGVQYEQKSDGYRTVVFNSDRVFVQSRRGADLTISFPELASSIAALPSCVLDGELVIWGDGALDFPHCSNACRPPNRTLARWPRNDPPAWWRSIC
jgi:ATP-dependent DNA ligase